MNQPSMHLKHLLIQQKVFFLQSSSLKAAFQQAEKLLAVLRGGLTHLRVP